MRLLEVHLYLFSSIFSRVMRYEAQKGELLTSTVVTVKVPSAMLRRKVTPLVTAKSRIETSTACKPLPKVLVAHTFLAVMFKPDVD